jgi:hypothetical protein
MICEVCQKEGRKSTIQVGGSSKTCVHCPPFYDEEGAYHCHDRNTTTTDYCCSNGHAWVKQSTGSCWCGWPNTEKEAPP